MRNYWVHLKVILDLIALFLKVVGALISGIFLAFFVIGLFTNFTIPWVIPVMVFGFGVFLTGYLLEAIININSNRGDKT